MNCDTVAGGTAPKTRSLLHIQGLTESLAVRERMDPPSKSSETCQLEIHL